MLFLDSFWPLLNLEQKFLHIMSEKFPLLFSCLFFVTLWLSASQFGSMQGMGKAYFWQCPEKRQVNVISLVVNDFDSLFWFSQKIQLYWATGISVVFVLAQTSQSARNYNSIHQNGKKIPGSTVSLLFKIIFKD